MQIQTFPNIEKRLKNLNFETPFYKKPASYVKDNRAKDYRKVFIAESRDNVNDNVSFQEARMYSFLAVKKHFKLHKNLTLRFRQKIRPWNAFKGGRTVDIAVYKDCELVAVVMLKSTTIPSKSWSYRYNSNLLHGVRTSDLRRTNPNMRVIYGSKYPKTQSLVRLIEESL